LRQHQVARRHHVLAGRRNAAQAPANARHALVHIAAGAQVQILAVLG
jgi:hypothetical protein